MKSFLALTALVILLANLSGCTTVYKAAVDERNIGTIASDTKIKASIVDAYVDDKTVKALSIFTAVYEGDVYLIGQYETSEQKKRALSIANETENVKSVTTYLLQKKEDPACGTKQNLGISARVKGKLIKDKEIRSTNIDVKSVQCNVVLVGLVRSKVEIEKSKAHANSVEGVRSVKSFIKVSR